MDPFDKYADDDCACPDDNAPHGVNTDNEMDGHGADDEPAS